MPRQSDNELIKEALKTGKVVEKIEKQLNSGKISFDEKKDLEKSKVNAEKEHSSAIDKIIERPNKEQIIARLEGLQAKDQVRNARTPAQYKDSYGR
ncbi:MAG: hypothetical protein FWD58_07920 [Firmicutes bacterium]|nr:hypothetical protein [Bacillota bacterium]